jgi:serine/threonine protein kinase
MTSVNPARLPSADQWAVIEAVFHQAKNESGNAREEVVQRFCTGDEELLATVRALLVANEQVNRPRPTTKARAADLSGRRAGNYQLDSLLGMGGMGSVYLAHRCDGQFTRQVAIKILGANLRNEFFTERFAVERQLLASLDHPNITRLLDSGVGSEGDPYLVLEYVDGKPITQYCDERRLGVKDRIRVFLQVCAAVEFAHSRQVLHRDLKPSNILVAANSGGQAGTAKLLDFGTAKLLAPPSDTNPTTTRFRMLTPQYASPEQLRGDTLGPATDVYSLGIVLYELLTGAWPFGNPQSVISGLERALRDVEPRHPRTVIRDEAAALRSMSKTALIGMLKGDPWKVIRKAVQAEPNRRYRTVEEFSSDLARYLEGRPQTLPYRVNKFVRRNWVAVSLAATFVLGLSTAVAVREAWVARDQLAQANSVTRLLQDLILSANPEDVKNRTVLQALEIAADRLDHIKNQPDVELKIRAELGHVYVQNSRIREAEKQLRRAETLARQTANDQMLASVLLSLANVENDPAKVKAEYLEALQLARAKGSTFPPALQVGLYSEVGQYLGNQTHSLDVERMLREAVRVGRETGVPKPDLEVAITRLAQYLRGDNRIYEAEPLLLEVLQMAGSHRTVSCGQALEELGFIRFMHGDQKGGERYFTERRDLLLDLAGPENDATLDARSRWAGMEAYAGRVPEALKEMQDNLVYCRKVYPPGSSGLWSHLTTMAYILNQANRPAEAWPLAKESLECLGRDPANWAHAQAEAEAGVALAMLHRYDEALPYLETTLRIWSVQPGFGPESRGVHRMRHFIDLAHASAHN